MVLRIRKLGVTALAMATLCSTISRLVAADPSVEVFTQHGKVTRAGEGDETLFPYAPRFSVTLEGGYDDNVNTSNVDAGSGTSTGGGGSAFTKTHVTLTKDLRMPRTQLSIVIGGGVTYYFDKVSGGTKVTGSLDATLTHKVSPRLTLSAVIDAAQRTEPQFETDLGPQRSANYFSTTDTLTASYMWSPRLSTSSNYQLRLLNYADTSVNAVDAGKAGQDRVEQTFAESLHFLWSPRTTITTDYRFGLIDYDSAPRDSLTHTVLGGLEYRIHSRSKATLQGGATFRKYEDQQNGEQTNPYASASLNYVLSSSTSLKWTARYSVEEPNSAVALSRTTFRTGLTLAYKFTPRITAHLALNYNHNVNSGLLASGAPGADQLESTEDVLHLVLGVKYAVSKRVALDLGYEHTKLDSERRANGGYSRNRYSAGLSLSY